MTGEPRSRFPEPPVRRYAAGMTVMSRIIVDEEGMGAEIISLARAVSPPASPSRRRRRLIPVVRSQARAAGGTDNDLVNVKIMRETAGALARPDIPETEAAAEAVALLTQIAPRHAREALAIRRMIALDQMAMESIQLARASTEYPMLRDAYASQACALSKAALELDEALERRRVGKAEQRVIVQHIRGNQVVGLVNK